MTRFVELPTVSERGSVVWINPDHVVSVEASHQEGRCWLLSEMGCRTHIALSQDAVVECLVNQASLPPMPDEVDLRDSVRENLTR